MSPKKSPLDPPFCKGGKLGFGGAGGGFLCVFLLCTCLLAASVSALEVPYLAGRVNDLAGLLSEGTEVELEAELAALERETGAQMAVLTLPSLEGDPLEDFSIRVVEEWQLGRADVDDGILLLVVRDERRIRIEVGYGLEPVLTDLQARRVISELMVPSFRSGDFEGGIRSAVDALAGTVRGQEGLIPPERAAGSGLGDPSMSLGDKVLFLGVFTLVVGVFSFVAAGSSGCISWFLYLFLMPFYLVFPAGALGWRAGLFALGSWIVAFPFLHWWLRGRLPESRRHRDPWLTVGGGGFGGGRSSGGWSFGRSSGGGFSGGGFSGGGGGFGGGGASGSW